MPPSIDALSEARPRRVLGLFDATSVVVGAIVGVGIFFTPSKVAALTGSAGLALGAWGLAGLIALCGAFTFAELGGRYHASGAQYEILRDAYGPFTGFLFVFCNATAIQGGSIGIISLICAFNLLAALGRGGGQGLGGPGVLALAAGLILTLTAANAAGVRWGARIQNLTVAGKVGALLAVVGLAALAPPAPAAGIPPELPLGPAAGLLAALVPCLFSFGGWQQALWIAGEVKEPRRNLPRAILGGVLAVIAVYLLANWAFLHLLGAPAVAGSRALAADAVAVRLPGLGRRLVAAAVAVSAFGVLNAQLLTGPRLVYGMACDGRFFPVFARLHPRLGTPFAAIALIGLTALGLLLAAGPGGIDRLLNGLVFIDGIFFVLTGAALLVLRRRLGPPPGGAFRVPAYPWLPLLFILGEGGVVAGAYLDPSVRGAAFIGAAWIAGAALFYRARFRTP
ncbi:MAG: amino acid permease [Acidobacteria bacterium]|nr:amino acid permease [Acidobacteriota bacterium]